MAGAMAEKDKTDARGFGCYIAISDGRAESRQGLRKFRSSATWWLSSIDLKTVDFNLAAKLLHGRKKAPSFRHLSLNQRIWSEREALRFFECVHQGAGYPHNKPDSSSQRKATSLTTSTPSKFWKSWPLFSFPQALLLGEAVVDVVVGLSTSRRMTTLLWMKRISRSR